MRIRSHSLLVFLTVATLHLPAAGGAPEQPVLKVGIYQNPPAVFSTPNGQPAGLYVDLLNEIARQEGWQLEYVPAPWPALLEQLKQGEIDLLTAIEHSTEREAIYDFNQSAISKVYGVIYTQDGAGIRTITDLEGKSVALLKGDMHTAYFRQALDALGINVRPVVFLSYDEVFAHVKSGQVDAGLVANHFGLAHGEEAHLVSTAVTLKPMPLYLAVPEGLHRERMDTVDRYLEKWKAEPYSFYHQIYSRWMEAPASAARLQLTPAEQAWIKAHPVVRLGYDPSWPPFEWADERGQPLGLSTEYIQRIAALTGLTFEWLPGLSWPQVLEGLQKGTVDMNTALVYSPDREHYLTLTKPYLSSPQVYMVRSGKGLKRALAAYAGRKVGTTLGYSTQHFIEKQYPDLELVLFPSPQEGLIALATGEIEAFAGNLAVLTYTAQQNNLTNLEVGGKIQGMDETGMHMGARKELPELLSILGKALAAIPATERLAMAQKWVPLAGLKPAPKRVALTPAEQAWIKAHPVVRLGYDPSWPPFEWVDKQGQARGLSTEYIQRIAALTGLTFKRVPGLSWPQIREGLQKGSIDMAPSAQHTPDRGHYLNLTKPYLFYSQVYMVRSGKGLQGGMAAYAGRKVGTTLGYSTQYFLERNYPDLELVLFNSPKEGLIALATGEIEAYAGNLAVLTYMAQNNNLANLEVGGKVHASGVRMGVRKELPELLSILDKALDAIPAEDRLAITQKWMPLAGLKPTPKHVALTPKEQAWLKEHPVIRVSSEADYLPFDFRVGEEPAGYSIEYVELLAERLGLRLEYVKDTWANLLKRAEAKEVDLVHTIFKFPAERERYLNFTRPYKKSVSAIVIRSETEDIARIEDLSGKTVALTHGDAMVSLLKKLQPEARQRYFDDYRSTLMAVALGHADAAITELPVASYLIRKFSIPDLKFVEADVAIGGHDQSFRLAVRKDWPILIGILEKAMEALSVEELRKLNDKWLPLGAAPQEDRRAQLTDPEKVWLEQHKNIRLGIDPNRPPFEFIGLGLDYRGVAADFVAIMNQELGLKMKPVPGLTWAQVMAKAQTGEIDVLPCVVKTPDRSEYLNFTEPYLTRPLVILSREDAPLYDGVANIEGSIALIESYFFEEILRRDYPDKDYRVVTSVREAIQAVENGEADAFIGNLTTISYELQKRNIQKLRVSSYTEYQFSLRFAVRKDWPELVGILNKKLAAMPEVDKKQIIASWSSFRVEKAIDWAPVLRWGLVIFVSIGGALSFLAHTNRKLAYEVVQRKKSEEKAEAANRAKSEFLANMSHEIRTPMNSILGFTEIMRAKFPDPQLQRYLDPVYSSGKALLSLINDILDLSKVEAGKLELQHSAVSVEQLIAEMKIIFSPKIADHGLELQTHCGGSLPPALLLDKMRLRQVLLNLIGNAIKFTPQGQVRVTAEAQPEDGSRSVVTLILEVADTGIGIPANQQQAVFSDFTQVNGQKTSQYGGTGLGLAISHRLIEMMGGELSVQSEVGQGSTFRMVLHGIEVAGVIADEATDGLDVDAIVFAPATILIVDDIDHNRDLIHSFLSNWDFKFWFAENGQQAIDQARAYQPDLILMDMKMPVMDGYEAADIMRHDDALKEIPVVAVSASALTQDEAAISKLCAGYLRKPISRKDLIEEVMKYLDYSLREEKEAAPPAPIQRGHNPAKLAELLQQLEGEAGPQWDHRQQLSISGIGAFAETLTRLGDQFEDPPFADWGTRLQRAIAEFDIEAINQQMAEFPNLLQQLKDDLSRLER